MMLALGEQRILFSQQAQQAMGAQYAVGGLLFLQGDLGAGKTTFVQGLVAAYGFQERVTSPTYSLMHLYPTSSGSVLHIDAYRIGAAQELYELDLEDQMQQSVMTVIEWGQLLYDDFPEAPILQFEHQTDGRKITRIR